MILIPDPVVWVGRSKVVGQSQRGEFANCQGLGAFSIEAPILVRTP